MEFSEEFNNKYEVIKLLGQGSMGAVYLARELSLSRLVAIKFLTALDNPAAQAYDRFQEEARVCATLKDPNIVALYVSGQEGKTPYLVFEYVKGKNLLEEIRSRGRLESPEVLEIGLGIVSGLICAHSHNIFHRDLKPGNVILREEDGQPMILDFGMAKSDLRDNFKTRQGLILGTPLYMAPELIKRAIVDARTDLYATGCSLYESLAGRPPFLADSEYKVVKMQVEDDPPPLTEFNPKADADPRLVEIIQISIRKNPDNRFQSARSMMRCLNAVKENRPWPVEDSPLFQLKEKDSFQSWSGKPAGYRSTHRRSRRIDGSQDRSVGKVLRSLARLIFLSRGFLALFFSILFVSVVILSVLWRDHRSPAGTMSVLVTPDGTVSVNWHTEGVSRDVVFCAPTGSAKASEGIFKKEEKERQSHQIDIGGLESGKSYDLRVVSSLGQTLWSEKVRVPGKDEITISYEDPDRALIKIRTKGIRSVLTDAKGQVLKDAKVTRHEDEGFQIAVPIDFTTSYTDLQLEVEQGPRVRCRYKIPFVRGLALQLLEGLKKLDAGDLIRKLVRDNHFDKNITFAHGGGRNKNPGFVPSGFEILPEAKRKAQTGYFRDQLISALSTDPLWSRLETLRKLKGSPRASARFFGNSHYPVEVQLGLYHSLLKLHYLDLVPLYQDEGQAIKPEEIYEPLVKFDYRMEAPDSKPGEVPVAKKPLGWATDDYKQWLVFSQWQDSFPVVYRSIFDGTHPSKPEDLQSSFQGRREFTVPNLSVKGPKDRVILRAVVLALSPAYFFEVSFRSAGKPERSLKLIFHHPGLRDWYLAMDFLKSDSNGSSQAPSASSRDYWKDEDHVRKLWGEIEASIASELIPPAPFTLSIAYRRIPDVPSDSIMFLQRTAFTKGISLRVSP